MYTAVFCWLIIRSVTHMHPGPRHSCAKLSVLSCKELEFWVSREMPLYFPPHPTPQKRGGGRLIQLFSSEECPKNAIPPSKPPPSPSPPGLCSPFILICEESFKKVSRSLIKRMEGKNAGHPSFQWWYVPHLQQGKHRHQAEFSTK